MTLGFQTYQEFLLTEKIKVAELAKYISNCPKGLVVCWVYFNHWRLISQIFDRGERVEIYFSSDETLGGEWNQDVAKERQIEVAMMADPQVLEKKVLDFLNSIPGAAMVEILEHFGQGYPSQRDYDYEPTPEQKQLWNIVYALEKQGFVSFIEELDGGLIYVHRDQMHKWTFVPDEEE